MNKPYITIKCIVCEILGILTSVAGLAISIVQASTTDTEIPISFNAAGEPNAYGSPWIWVIFPITMIIVSAILCLTLHFLPSNSWNIPFKITQANALPVYKDMAFMLALTVFEFGLMTLFMSFFFGKGEQWLEIVVFVFLGVFGLSMVAMIGKMNSDKNIQ